MCTHVNTLEQFVAFILTHCPPIFCYLLDFLTYCNTCSDVASMLYMYQVNEQGG